MKPSNYQDIELADDSVLVYQPRFVADESRIAMIVRLPNGQLLEVEKDYSDLESRFVRDARLQYSKDEIRAFTEREAVVTEKKRIVEHKAAEREAQRIADEQNFEAKARAFEIPEVRDFPHKHVVRRLRKAASPLEVAALVSYILGESFRREG